MELKEGEYYQELRFEDTTTPWLTFKVEKLWGPDQISGFMCWELDDVVREAHGFFVAIDKCQKISKLKGLFILGR